jgi:hypothetical protein
MSNKTDFKTGIYKRTSSYWSTKDVLCGCGNTFRIERGQTLTCSVCNNSNFKEVYTIPKKRTLIDSMIELIEKNDTYFHVKKTEITALIDDGKRIKELVAGKTMQLKVDLKNRFIKLFDENNVEIEANNDNLELFSKNINNPRGFISLVSTERNKDLFSFGLNQFGKTKKEKTQRVHRGFQTIINAPFLEILYYCGFSPSTIWNNMGYLNKSETRPYKMIGVPKYLVKYLMKADVLSDYYAEKLNKLDKLINGNNLKSVLTILDEESNVSQIFSMYDILMQLYKEYGYKDLKKLVLYLAREVKLQQGIDKPSNAITVLRDYVRMSVEMKVKFEKYPKSLKKEHDIILLNYKTMQDEKKRAEFEKAVTKEDYSKLAFRDKVYSIILPKEPNDVIREGESLSHCVASYVNDIIKERCKIIFMRPTKQLDESLLTIEVRDNKYIRQIRGKQNRNALKEEMNFISKWADKLQLVVSGY